MVVKTVVALRVKIQDRMEKAAVTLRPQAVKAQALPAMVHLESKMKKEEGQVKNSR